MTTLRQCGNDAELLTGRSLSGHGFVPRCHLPPAPAPHRVTRHLLGLRWHRDWQAPPTSFDPQLPGEVGKILFTRLTTSKPILCFSYLDPLHGHSSMKWALLAPLLPDGEN